MKNIFFQALLFISIFFTACNRPHYNPQKLGLNDPFKKTMVPSSFFEIDTKTAQIVEGGKGTIIVLPKGCFSTEAGNTFEGAARIELAEATNLSAMLLSNLTTTSNGTLLQTDGMIYLNATTVAGEKLIINKHKPVYIQVPTKNCKAGMKAYRGIRNDDGSMDWTDPEEIDNYLIEVDMSTLNFLPAGFETAVKKAMPLFGYQVATKALIDSLYFSFASNDVWNWPFIQNYNLNEPYYNTGKEIKNGEYTQHSYSGRQATDSIETNNSVQPNKKGISPARIKVIQSEKFANTFIATKEFEARLQVIFETCNNDILELYINNLEKPLWKVDEMAAKLAGKETGEGKKFIRFAALRQTNVRNAGEAAGVLKEYYKRQLLEIQRQLQEAETLGQEKLRDHLRVADSVAAKYRELLLKREKYRMERYSFAWTNTGWINIDSGVPAKVMQKLEVKVPGGKAFDRVEVYTVYTDIKSIYHLETIDKEMHFVGRDPERSMLMVEGSKMKLVAIAYNGENGVSMGVTDYTVGSSTGETIHITPTTLKQVQQILSQIEAGTFNGDIPGAENADPVFNVSKQEPYREENSIAVDLAYQAFFYKEQQWQNVQSRQIELCQELFWLAYPCSCNEESATAIIAEGRNLFKSNCASCHNPASDGTGPMLKGATSRYSMPWLIAFTKNWREAVNRGDKAAIKMAESRPTEMNIFLNLRECEIKAIFKYIDTYGQQ